MKKRIVFIADGRSPIALGWMSHFVSDEYETHLISTFPCEHHPSIHSLHIVPVAFSGAAGSGGQKTVRAPGGARGIRVRSAVRHWVGPFTVKKASARVASIIQSLSPDLVHALRIPFEGMVAAGADIHAPLIISVWGNDFTLHAATSPGMKRLTREAMARADGLHTDCQRDVRLATQWGFREAASIVLPGGGGIKRDIFHPGRVIPAGIDDELAKNLSEIPYDVPVVINPRGFRAYVRNDTFFKSIPLVLRDEPEAIFLCVGMRDESEAHAWVRSLQIESNVRLLPRMSPREMAAGYGRAWVSVSPSEHDGTPNTFLESIACGCFPIVGDLESMREWIEAGKNGLLLDPGDPRAWAQAIVRAIRDDDLRTRAKSINEGLIDEKADYGLVQAKAREFYRHVLDQYDPDMRANHV